MKIHFFEPPAAQQTGGLEAAIRTLRTALNDAGVVVDNGFPGTAEAGHVVHFHGLWQFRHQRVAHACRRRRIPYVVSPHGMLELWAWRHKWWKKWPYFQLIEKRYLAGAECLLATGPGEAARLSRFFPERRIEVLPLGLTGKARPDYARARNTLGWRSDETVLLFLSRIHVKKGLDLLLAALLQADFPAGTRLAIVGGGEASYIERIRAFTEKHRHDLPQIDWVGEIWGEQRWAYFQGADLFCLPSHSENFGLSVLEACQVGTPVLTSSETPWGTVLKEPHGYICQPEIGSVSASLRSFFATARSSGDARHTIADWARSNYGWEALGTRYVALYQSCTEL